MTEPVHPPAVEGVSRARPVDAPRLLWWSQTGLRHGMGKGHWGARTLSGLLWFGWWPAFPLVAIVQAVRLGRQDIRYYLSREGDAVLAIRVTRTGWKVEDHLSAQPGTGAGARLRRQLLPALTAAADAAGVPIHATAASTELAAQYTHELPGLVDVDRGWPRGRRLRRDPEARS